MPQEEVILTRIAATGGGKANTEYRKAASGQAALATAGQRVNNTFDLQEETPCVKSVYDLPHLALF